MKKRVAIYYYKGRDRTTMAAGWRALLLLQPIAAFEERRYKVDGLPASSKELGTYDTSRELWYSKRKVKELSTTL